MIFTIIIATCGRPERLRRTLKKVAETILASGRSHRIMVVDNHPDHTARDVVQAFAFNSVVACSYLESAPCDKSKALNAGVKASKTEWLAFTDDDTLPDTQWLISAERCVTESGWRVFAGRIISDEQDGKMPSWLIPGRSGRLPVIGGAIVKYEPLPQSGKLRSTDPVPYGANVFVRRDVFAEFGGYDEALWALCGKAALGVEDGEFGIRLKQAREPVGYCHEAVIIHPIHFERCRLKTQLKLAYHYGWRDPIVFFHPGRPLVDGYRFRILASHLAGAMKAALQRDQAAVVADLIQFARCLGTMVSRISSSYRKRGRQCLLIDRVGESRIGRGEEGFACSECGSDSLRHEKGSLVCPLCARRFQLRYGVPVFTAKDEFYWGELSRERMQALIASPQPVEEGLRELLAGPEASLADYLSHYALDPARAGWKYVTALPRQGVALDFGCGWGAITLSLADSMRCVYAVDLVPERVAVTVRRAREAGYAGVVGCVSGGIPRLPFPDRMFDLVVVNGVLEWVPEAYRGNPRHLQLQFLREVSRVVKSSGQVYIGIENRFGAHYFLGKREEHTKLRFISLLPRWVARAYHRLWLRKPFRAYTHGQRGLTRLLHAAGFWHVNTFTPYPDYREFFRVIALDDNLWYNGAFRPKSRFGRLAFRLTRRIPRLRRFVGSFSIVATRQYVGASCLERFTRHLVAMGEIPEGSRVENYRVTRTAAVQIVFGPGERHIATLPLDRSSRQRIKRSVHIRKAIMNLEPVRNCGDPAFCAPVRGGLFEGVEYKVEPFSRGQVRAVGDDDRRFYAGCLECLGKLQGVARHVGVCRLNDDELPGLMAAADILLASLPEPTKGALSRILGVMQVDAETVLTIVHGDYHRGNILWDGPQRIDRVIDWDYAMVSGLPVWDAMALYAMDIFQTNVVWGDAFSQAARLCLDGDAAGVALRCYLEALGLRRRDLWYGVLTFPIIQLRHKLAGAERRQGVIFDRLPVALDGLLTKAMNETDLFPAVNIRQV